MKSIREGLVMAVGIAGFLSAGMALAITPAGGAPTTPHPTAVEILGATAAGRGHAPIPLSPAGRFGKLLVQMSVPAGRWWISGKLTAQSEKTSAPTATYASCKLAKLIYSAAASQHPSADRPAQVLKGSVALDQSLLEITKYIPPAGGPGQSSGPNVVSAVVTLRSTAIIGVLCTDAGNPTEATNVVLSAVGG
jgi:hypothetical protein